MAKGGTRDPSPQTGSEQRQKRKGNRIYARFGDGFLLLPDDGRRRTLIGGDCAIFIHNAHTHPAPQPRYGRPV